MVARGSSRRILHSAVTLECNVIISECIFCSFISVTNERTVTETTKKKKSDQFIQLCTREILPYFAFQTSQLEKLRKNWKNWC